MLEGATDEEIRRKLHENRIEKVLVVNEQFELKGMVTLKDMVKAANYPNAARDEQGQLLVGAAVGTGRTPKIVLRRWLKTVWTLWW